MSKKKSSDKVKMLSKFKKEEEEDMDTSRSQSSSNPLKKKFSAMFKTQPSEIPYKQLKESPSPPPNIPAKNQNQSAPEVPPRTHSLHKNLMDL